MASNSVNYFSPQKTFRPVASPKPLTPPLSSKDPVKESAKPFLKPHELSKSEVNLSRQRLPKLEDYQKRSNFHQSSLSPVRCEGLQGEYGLVLKEWKIQKTNELIQKFENQMQALLSDNEKLTRAMKQKQNEIDRLKSSSFSMGCKLKELESKAELLTEQLAHSEQLLGEKEEEVETWKMKYFETEQKTAMFDSMEYKLMEAECLILEDQKRLEGLAFENDRLKGFIELSSEGRGNERWAVFIGEMERIASLVCSNPEGNDNFLNLSFQTPEKNKETLVDVLLSQLESINSFISSVPNPGNCEGKELETLKAELQKSQKINETLNLEVKAKTAKIHELENPKDGKKQSNNPGIFEMAKKNQMSERVANDLRREVDEKSKKIEEVNGVLRNLERELEEKRASFEALKLSLEEKEALTGTLELKNRELIENAARMQEMVRKGTEFSEGQGKEIKELSVEILQKTKRINELELEVMNSQQQSLLVERARNENEGLRAEAKEFRRMGEELRAKNSELMRKLEDVESRCRAVVVERGELETKIREEEQKEIEIADLREKIRLLTESQLESERRSQVVSLESDTIRNELLGKTQESESKDLEIAGLNQTLARMSQEMQKVASERDFLQARLGEMERAARESSEKGDEIHRNTLGHAVRIRDLEQENAELRERVNRLTSELESSGELLAQKSSQIQEFETLISSLPKQPLSRPSEPSEQEDTLQLRSQIEQLKRTVCELQNPIQAREALKEESKKEVLHLKEELRRKSEEIHSIAAEIQHKNGEIAHLKELLTVKEEEILRNRGILRDFEAKGLENERLGEINREIREKLAYYENEFERVRDLIEKAKDMEQVPMECSQRNEETLKIIEGLKVELSAERKTAGELRSLLVKKGQETRLFFTMAVVVIALISMFFFLT